MRNPFTICSICLLLPLVAQADTAFDYQFQISYENSELDGLSLGDDPDQKSLQERSQEFEVSLEYQFNQDLYAFFVASYLDEVEEIEPRGPRESQAGVERKELGIGYYFGDEIESELKIGRVEIESASEWWVWWDEELDLVLLDSAYGDFEAMIAFGKEQARESSAQDFIDPEERGIERILASLSWEFSSEQFLQFYYLDQADESGGYNVGDFTRYERADEADADLTWNGVSYLGNFEVDSVGEFELELHYVHVSGDETLYEIDEPDPLSDPAEIVDFSEQSVSGSATSYLLNWSPAAAEDWTLRIGFADGSGDSNLNDNRDKSFRQNGLQGDSEDFGELYQPAISNIEIQLIGIAWEPVHGVTIMLKHLEYEQNEVSDEIGDVSIEADVTGLNGDLGSEIDLVVTIEAIDGLELKLIAAEFEAGKAYGSNEGETSRYVNFEIAYDF